MRIHIFLDNKLVSRQSEIEGCLNILKDAYKEATPISWDYEIRDFASLKWVEYLPNALGIDWSTVYKDVAPIKKDSYDNIIYVVEQTNWHNGTVGTGGWNLGTPINGFCVEIVKAYTNQTWITNMAFAMEIAHSWNDVAIQEAGNNLLSLFNVKDFDNEVVHCVTSQYGVLKPDGSYFTNYDYTRQLGMVKDILKEVYQKRLDRFNNPPTFQFSKDLYFGQRNPDVLELQKRFIAEGLASYQPTGFFGSLTLKSAIAFQKKYNIFPQFGYIGSRSRAILNSVSPSPDVAIEESELFN